MFPAAFLYARNPVKFIFPEELSRAREVSMPIRAFLEGRKFDFETIRMLGIGFEMALAALRLADKDIANEVVSGQIIALAEAGERDPERLCEGVLRELQVPPLRLAGTAVGESGVLDGRP
jgi:hypothetical protein